MPETTVSPPPAPTKGKVEKAHHLLSLVSTAAGVAGALGATFVWLFASLYVGDVEVQPDRPVGALVVKVYDRKGQSAEYHMKSFQLMPGSYHLEVSADGGPAQHSDVEVRFHEKCPVPVRVAPAGAGLENEPDRTEGKHHWWQFWRK